MRNIKNGGARGDVDAGKLFTILKMGLNGGIIHNTKYGLKGDVDRCVLQRGAKTVAMFCPGTDIHVHVPYRTQVVRRTLLVELVH